MISSSSTALFIFCSSLSETSVQSSRYAVQIVRSALLTVHSHTRILSRPHSISPYYRRGNLHVETRILPPPSPKIATNKPWPPDRLSPILWRDSISKRCSFSSSALSLPCRFGPVVSVSTLASFSSRSSSRLLLFS